jgi:hypothetical protein
VFCQPLILFDGRGTRIRAATNSSARNNCGRGRKEGEGERAEGEHCKSEPPKKKESVTLAKKEEIISFEYKYQSTALLHRKMKHEFLFGNISSAF